MGFDVRVHSFVQLYSIAVQALIIMAINLGNRNDQWTFLEKISEVDLELRESFAVCIPYALIKRYSQSFRIAGRI